MQTVLPQFVVQIAAARKLHFILGEGKEPMLIAHWAGITAADRHERG